MPGRVSLYALGTAPAVSDGLIADHAVECGASEATTVTGEETMRRLRFLAACVVALGLALSRPAALADLNPGTPSAVELSEPVARGTLRVAILADRTTGVDAGLEVLRQAVREINLLRPDLVLHIGDLVPGYTRDLEQWEADVDRVQAILGELEAPLFPVAGNHDVITGTDDRTDRRGEQIHMERFGPLYYSFDCGDVHFVCLYTEETLQSEPRLSSAQKEWLRADLEATDARDTFVFMHKPLWEYEGSGWGEVHGLLAAHRTRAVFGGHFHHYYKSTERDGIQYYVLGVTGGRTFSPELAGGLEHYCLLDVDAQGYSLALVKPGAILADDYIVSADFKAMEALRFLTPEETGVQTPFPSPERGPIAGEVAVEVTNPLAVPLPVSVRGVGHRGEWVFSPPGTTLILAPGDRRTVFLGLSSPRVAAERLLVPMVEVQYTYTDSRGRTVPIALRRRVPLVRRCSLRLSAESVSPDGLADESCWQDAPLLSTALYHVSPFETGETGPAFRLIATRAGLYVHVKAEDSHVSSFRGERMLSDALFVGGIPLSAAGGLDDLSDVPVVIVYPFSDSAEGAAERAFWDPRTPAGVPVQGVHAAGSRLADGEGWQCEAFVPWDLLGGSPLPPSEPLLFNVGAWDNDGELFTDLYSWASTGSAAHWGVLELMAEQ
jgi:hypothetical protein